MARRPKGSVLRTCVIQSKLTPRVGQALDQFATQQQKSISTVVQEVIEKELTVSGFLND
jgi:predicted DNA-binding protein|tara:strand:+ start:227 stop:403 length:177 start_codon:yes stop_codon:yes gene_type:complete